MKRVMVLLPMASMVLLAACSTPEEKAAKAQERTSNSQNELIQERLRLTKEHEQCVADAGNDQTQMAQCDQILKRVQALQ